MSVVEVSVSSTTELVDAVLSIGREEPDRLLWHRGHSCAAHTLTASLPRKLRELSDLLPIERRLITRFRQKSLPYWPAGYPQNDWEQLFAMQHYGLPTRLLDWSENVFVALYFAVSDLRHEADHDGVPCSPTIWMLDPARWNRNAKQLEGFPDVGVLTTDAEDLKAYAPINQATDLSRRYPQPLAIYGSYNSARITAQRGTFTVTGNTLESMEDAAFAHAEPTLWRYRLDYDRAVVREDLRNLGFAESMIYPDLGGVSREIAISEGLL